MIFSSFEFIFLFLPFTLIGYFTLSKITHFKIQKLFLAACSLFFYGFFNWKYLTIILSSIGVNYILGYLLTQVSVNKSRKVILIIGILFNIGLLGYYKYYDFFIDNFNSMIGTEFVLKSILLPLGISFFTFQQFSFLLSLYKKKEKIGKFNDYIVFVSFFPQLIAGPIVLYSEMIPQFQDEKRRFVNYENLSLGLYMFSIGLFKKIVIADTVALFANNGYGYAGKLGFFASWMTLLSFTLQIYFDFSGYSDMAIGLGKMFNIDLPLNFNSPYKSNSIKDFWSRWHITLGRALASYIYIPLGGNKKGRIRMYVNLLITFLISGLWHGAAWTFVIWGLMHGIVSIVERIFIKQISKIPNFIRRFSTILFIVLTWNLFRANSIEEAMKMYRGLIDFKNVNVLRVANLSIDSIVTLPSFIAMVYVFSTVITLLLIVQLCKNMKDHANDFKCNARYGVYTYLLFLVSIVHLSRVSPFIYFNF